MPAAIRASISAHPTVTAACAVAPIAAASPSRIGTIGRSTILAPMIARRPRTPSAASSMAAPAAPVACAATASSAENSAA